MPGHERRGAARRLGEAQGRSVTASRAVARWRPRRPTRPRPRASTLEERAKIRTAALIEFEIDRDPDRPNGEIAKVVRCSVPAVLKARKRLEAEAK